MKIDADDHSFIVGLSTLASAVSVRQEGGPAHEFGYLVEAMSSRYNLGYAVYDLFYDALQDGQFSYFGPGNFSNRASWYVNDAHEMIPMGGEPFAFATQAAGATAVCETYYYIGNLPNQYTGGDVTLYDFVVMVETSLTTGRQTLLLSVPVDAVPARALGSEGGLCERLHRRGHRRRRGSRGVCLGGTDQLPLRVLARHAALLAHVEWLRPAHDASPERPDLLLRAGRLHGGRLLGGRRRAGQGREDHGALHGGH
ncbi:MAG: hypothetical protein Q4B91_07585 [Atopobiaceae bacterium]|nr:hypothetical protein [Atopobiaceae bacterium]